VKTYDAGIWHRGAAVLVQDTGYYTRTGICVTQSISFFQIKIKKKSEYSWDTQGIPQGYVRAYHSIDSPSEGLLDV
jgi:hypothetical protein